MKHYPHHIGDFDRATRHLTRIERSIYRDLIDLYYDTEEPLTLDLQKLCRKIIANELSTDVERVLNEFFTETPNGWFNSRCDTEIAAYRSNNSQRAQAGKASAAAKALKKQQAINANSTSVERALNERTNGVDDPNNGASTNQSTNQPINQSTKKKAPTATQPVFLLPDWIDSEVWEIWHQHPKRKKITNEQKQLAVDRLAAWRDSGVDHALALRNAATNGWQGLFEPDNRRASVGSASSGGRYAAAAKTIFGNDQDLGAADA